MNKTKKIVIKTAVILIFLIGAVIVARYAISKLDIWSVAKSVVLKDKTEDTGSKSKEDIQPPKSGYTEVIDDYDSRGDDIKVIPDKYNTGCDLSKTMVTAEPYIEQGMITAREEDYVINLSKEEYSAEKVVFENMYINDLSLYFANNNEEYPDGTIEFINCYFGKGVKITTDCLKKFIFTNCDFLDGHVTAVNSSFYKCKFYKMYGDAIQACFNVIIEDCYIYDIGYGNAEEYHADGIQIAGFGNTDAYNIYVDNVRIEVPQCAPEYGQNAAIIIKMDMADGYDMTFKNIYVNGGAYTMYVMPHNYSLKNLRFENLKAGYSHKWKGWLYEFNIEENDYGWNGAYNDNCSYQDKAIVTSVISDEGLAKLCITNNTESDRQLRVETDKGEFELTIPKVLIYEETEQSKSTFDECNIDMVYEVDAEKYVKVYDGEELIRYKEL